MAKHLEVTIEEDTLVKAIKLMDPEGIMVPGTKEHDDTKAMVTKWLNSYGTAYVLEVVMNCMKHIEVSKKPD